MGPADVLAVVAGATLLATTGAALALALRIDGGAALVLATLVLAAGTAIGLAELLSIGHAVTRAGLLAGGAAAAGLALAAWARAGRPRPRMHSEPSARGHPVVTIVVGAAAFAATAQLVLALLVVPNEVDGLLYHLLRSAMVVQDRTAIPFTPTLRGDPATMNPANAELLVAWTMALSHGDRLAALVQWTCLPALGLLVYAGARWLGAERAGAAFAGGVAVLLPEPLLQATTVQTDLLLSVLAGAALLFGARAVRDRGRGDLVVAAVAVGLAVGTKTSALLLAPALAVLVLLAGRRYRAPPRLLWQAAGLAAAAVLALGSLGYAVDLARTGDPLGGTTHSIQRDFTQASAPLNVARSAWSVFVEAPGMPRMQSLERGLDPLRFALFGHISGSYYDTPTPVRFTIDEDTDGLGLVGLFVLLPVLAVAVVRGGARRALVIAGVGFAVALTARTGYSPDNARLVLPGLALTLPLLAWARWRWPIAVLAIAGAVPIVALNPHRSPFADPGLIAEGRVAQQLDDYDGMAQIVGRLDRLVGPTAPLGFLHTTEFTYSSHPAYALFDAHLRRRLVPLGPRDVTPARLRARGLAGAVVWYPNCEGWACRPHLGSVPRVWLGAGGELVRAASPRPAARSR